MRSPRTLDYGTLITKWTCPQTGQHSSLAVGQQDGGAEDLQKEHVSILDSTLSRVPKGFRHGYADLPDAAVMWCRTVEDFTARSTELYKDRVYAIAGVAEEFNRHIDGRYVAGLWEPTFPAALLWWIEPEAVRFPRPLERLAPTWSWMSILGSVTYKHWKFLNERPMAELVDLAINLNSASARYGCTKDSYVVLRGRPQQARWTGGRSKLESFKPAWSQRKQPKYYTIAQHTMPDTSELQSADQDDLRCGFYLL